MDLAPFRISHGDDEPSGENLEYDPAFISLELAAQSSAEQQFGDSFTPASGPDHKEVLEHARDVLQRSHDIRAVVFLAGSVLATEGLRGFADCTGFLRWMVEEHWATCHPQLDADDDDDPTMRVNAVVALADPDNVLRAIRQAQLTESRAFGRFSLRDILIAEGEITPPSDMESPPDASTVAAAFQDTSADWLAGLMAAVDAAHADVRAVSAVFDDKVPGRGPDLDPLIRILRQIRDKFTSFGVQGDTESGAAEGAGELSDMPAGAGAPVGVSATGARPSAAPGAINSPQDVRNALDRIIAYYQRAEPSSPLPLLLLRAKRLVGADFMAIIKDMAPGGRDSVYMIGGIQEENEYD